MRSTASPTRSWRARSGRRRRSGPRGFLWRTRADSSLQMQSRPVAHRQDSKRFNGWFAGRARPANENRRAADADQSAVREASTRWYGSDRKMVVSGRDVMVGVELGDGEQVKKK